MNVKKIMFTFANVKYTFANVQYVHNQKQGREGNILFNDTLNTFYLRLYGIRHIVKDHSDSERGMCIYTIAIEPPLGCHATTARVRPFSGLIWAT